MNFITHLHAMVQISKHTVVNTRRFVSAVMKTETFENPYAVFDHFSVDHNNNK